MLRIALAGSLVMLLAWSGSARAEVVSLGYKQDTGSYPAVFFAPDVLERAESFDVLITADPMQAVDYVQQISCTRKSDTVSTEEPKQSVMPPYSTVILPTIPEPDSCWVTVSAEAPFESGQAGTIRVDINGNRRPAPPLPEVRSTASYWTKCALPGWLHSGEAKVHGSVSCSRARAIAKAAWRKPSSAGHLVKSRGYMCRRNELRGHATIRCARGVNIIRIAGKLQS